MDLSIIIVSWNTCEILRRCLQSIYAETEGLSFEVIVVDNASHDDSVEMVSHCFPEVRLITNTQNLGFAGANNKGILQSKGENLLLLNSDTVILDGAITKALRFLKSQPTCGVLGCKAVYPDGSFQSTYYKVHNLLDLLMVRLLPLDAFPNNRLNRARYWGRIFTRPTEVEVVAGCFLLIRRQVVSEAGMLDEDFFMYGEEEEWCFRIRQKGWRILYFPLASIVHIHGYSAKKARKSLSLIARNSPLLVLEKTRGTSAAWFGNLIIATGTAIRLPFATIADILRGGLSSEVWGIIVNRAKILLFHATGLLRPVWRIRRQAEGALAKGA